MDLIIGWWEYQRLAHGTRAERVSIEPAIEQTYADVAAAVEGGGPSAVALLGELIDACPAADDVSTVGAGPLEDLIHEHGDALIDTIATTARQSPAFAEAMKSVWLETGHLTPETERRLAVWLA